MTRGSSDAMNHRSPAARHWPSIQRRIGVALGVLLLTIQLGAPAATAAAVISAPPAGTTAVPGEAAALPSGFSDNVLFSGLTFPIAVRFSPDGRVFVAEKSGIIKVYASLTASTPTVFADLSTQVHNFWDRGFLGFTLDPNFPTTPYVYALYAFDAAIGGTAPRWNDACPTPPGPTTDGCVMSGRLSRLTASGNVMTGSEQVLINDWCQQYPSHSVGDLRFGPDGALYVSGGDGASFTFLDYGQGGGGAGSPTPKNPCGDPPGGVGGAMSAPTAEGGSLRSQSVRRPAGEPVSLDGAILRVNPATGAAAAGNPLAGSSNANARRIVGYGLRNPFRFAFRPGTSELWIGDVGEKNIEEINRITNPLSSTVANAGWPCYEGQPVHSGWQALGVNLCTSLYANPTGLLAPYYSYAHTSTVVSGESCPTGSSSIAGIAFYSSGTYPSLYNNGLFFADHSRNCIWAMPVGANGLPSASKLQTFVAGAANPVALESGPGGDLYYVDYEGGKIHRVTYATANHAPVANIAANPTSGSAPLTVAFDGSGSTDSDPGETLSYTWDLDGNGTFGDAVLPTAQWTYPSNGAYTVTLRVTDSHGASDLASKVINVGGGGPTATIDTPASSLTWAVGDSIAFSGHAVDGQGAALPASALSWSVIVHHCPSDCHSHIVQTIPGVASGSISAPDHDYPSYLELQLTATAGSSTSTASVSLQPKTASLSIATNPTGLSIGAGTDAPAAAPFSKTVIAKSTLSVSAPASQVMGGTTWTFSSWSDGGAASHNVTVPATGLGLTATYTSAGGGGTTSYLSDLAWTTTANGWGPVEKDRSNGEKAAGDGLPITLNGTVFAKGLGGHAASDVRYALNGGCTSFTTKVGVDDEVGANGSVAFQIFADGTKLADLGVMTGASATQTLTVDVTGRTSLQLVITNGGDTVNYDHGDWADAQLTCGGGAPPPPPPPPPDTTPPTVTGRSPASGATGVVTSVRPTVTFSEAMASATISSTTFTLTPSGGSAVSASVSYDGPTLTATLTPSAALTAATTYTVRVKGGAGGVTDAAGNALAADSTATFTTASAGGGGTTSYLSDLAWTTTANGWGPVEKDRSNGEKAAGDGLPITLNGTVFAKGLGGHAASDVRYALNGGCTSFTTKVGVDDEVGANGSVAFQIFADGTKLADLGVMTGASATQTLTVDVTGRTSLQLVITNGGDTVNYDHGDWADAQLTCGGGAPPPPPPPPPDTTPPTVTGRGPASGATGVVTSVRPTVTFSEAMAPATISSTTFTLTPSGGSAVSASVSYDGPTLTATLTPSAALTAATTYTVRVKGGAGGVTDAAGNALAADSTATFTTASAGGGGTTSYLSDLAWTTTANGWGPVEKDRSNGEKAAGDGLPITLNGTVFAKGLGGHAASDVRYALNGGCTSFTTKVGVDDEVGANGSVAFQIFADGTKLADSGVMTGASATQTLTVDVTGRTSLQLVITNGGDTVNYDHGDWADAQLTCGGGAPPPPPPPPPPPTRPHRPSPGGARPAARPAS